jgi:hypothetical protein
MDSTGPYQRVSSGGFAEFGEHGVDAAGDALVAFNLAVPAAFFSVVGVLAFQLEAFAHRWPGAQPMARPLAGSVSSLKV